MNQKQTALVLGGGGAAGQAWMIGVVAGLAEAGADLTQTADLVIGTSSGATAAAWVRSGPLPPGQFEGIRREAAWGTTLASQVEALRSQGSRVEVITPDPPSRYAMGVNQMDPATRMPSAGAGFEQGKLEAGRLKF